MPLEKRFGRTWVEDREVQPYTSDEVVHAEDDLPDLNAQGEHQLEALTGYHFDGFVTISNPIRVGMSTPMLGRHGSVDGWGFKEETGDTLDVRVANLGSTTDIEVGEMNARVSQ